MMQTFFAFMTALMPILWDIYLHFQDNAGKPDDPERERQLAMRLVRAAKDAQARAELGGS